MASKPETMSKISRRAMNAPDANITNPELEGRGRSGMTCRCGRGGIDL